jgi:hypothetical protein
MVRKNFALTRVQKKQVRAIASKTVEKKAELKVYQPAAVSYYDWSSTVYIRELKPTSGIQDSLNSGRNGDKIQWKGLSIKGTATPGTNNNAVMRCMIVQYRGTAVPTAPPLEGYVDATANEVQTNMSLFYLRKQATAASVATDYKVLYDQIVRFDATNNSVYTPFEVKIKESDFKDSIIHYQTATTVHESPVYMFLFSDQAVATTTCQMLWLNIRSTFIDL